MNLIEALAVAVANPANPEHTTAVCIVVAFGLAFALALALIAYGACKPPRREPWRYDRVTMHMIRAPRHFKGPR